MCECQWWSLYLNIASVKRHFQGILPHTLLLSEDRLMQRIVEGMLFGDTHCDIEVSEHVRPHFSTFPPIFKKTVVSKEDFESLLKEYAENKDILSVQKNAYIRLAFTKRTPTTPLLLFYCILELVCKKIHRFVQYTPKKRFDSFGQSVLIGSSHGDEILNSGVAAETTRPQPKSSCGYQAKDWRRHKMKKYSNIEKGHDSSNSKNVRHLNHLH